MRHLLMPGLVLLLLLGAGGMKAVEPQRAEADSGHPVLAVLFHPETVLACGWHYNCDGVFGDNPSMGLDWNRCSGCSATTHLRLRIVLGGSGYEAKALTQSESGIVGCPKARVTYIRRVADNADYGRVIHLHSQAPSTYFANLATGDHTLLTGNMVPLGQDPCAGWEHVMQWYESLEYDTDWSQNVNGWPTEAACYHWSIPPCSISYAPWDTREYNFTFIS